MSAHTPGPWMVKATDYGFIGHGGDGSPLQSGDRAGANARLIAAAPALAKARAAIRAAKP